MNSDSMQTEQQQTTAIERKPNPRMFAERIKAGDSLFQAMVTAGYSEGTAKNGMAALSQTMKRALIEAHADLARHVTPEVQERFVRGALLSNAVKGEDRAVRSLELLGKDKTVAMWQSEAQVGTIVVGVMVETGADKGNAVGHSTIIDAEDLEPNQ